MLFEVVSESSRGGGGIARVPEGKIRGGGFNLAAAADVRRHLHQHS